METIEQERFQFWAGAEVLVKAGEEGEGIIFIEASNEKEDQQGDTVLQKALKAQVASYLKKGVISYDHLHKKEKDPKFIIGEPVEVKFPDERTLVKARLYPNNDIAKDILEKLKDKTTRLGASIGGFIVKRSKVWNEKLKKTMNYVTEIIWDEIALTFKPVNDATVNGVSVQAFKEFAKSFADEEMVKSLSAGHATDSASMGGGRAVIEQSMNGMVKLGERQKKLRDLIEKVKGGQLKTYEVFKSYVEENEIGDAKLLSKLILKSFDRIKSL